MQRIKKTFIFTSLVALLSILPIPLVALAGDFKAGEEKVTIGQNEVINDDVYLAAGEVAVDGTVNGDVFIAAGRTYISGTITGDLFVMSGQTLIRGTVSDDVRVGSGDVIIEGTIGDELLVAAGNVSISRHATVGGDIRAQAGQVTLGGTTGAVYANTGTLAIQEGAKVRGNVEYSADREATIPEGVVEGQVTRNHPTPAKKERGLAHFLTAASVVSLFVKIFMGILLLYVVPVKVETMVSSWRSQPWHNLLWGGIFLIAVPAVALLLLISVVGMPLGIAALLLYPIVLYLGSIIGMISVGFWLQALWKKEPLVQPDWLSIVFGGVIVWALKFIPIIGWVLALGICLIGIGALIQFDWNLYRRLRTDKIV